MHIALLNHSTRVSALEAALMAQAVSRQVALHVAPAWGIAPVDIAAYASPATVPPGAYVLAVQDAGDAPADADTLGWHTDRGGVFYGKIFVAPVLAAGGVVLYSAAHPGGLTVASVVSHEVLELVVDPAVNRWVDGPASAHGSQYSLEVADPVESDAYAIDAGSAGHPALVGVSNFVFPEWFDPQTPRGARVDQMRKLRAPFTMTAGGYMVVRAAPSRETAVYGEHYPAWRHAMRAQNERSRSRRRGCAPVGAP